MKARQRISQEVQCIGIVVNGNPQMIKGSGIAEAVFGCLGEEALKETENMRFRLGPQQAETSRITRGSPKWKSIAHTVMTDCNTQQSSKEQTKESRMSPIIAGIIEISQENQVTINLIVKRENEEIKNIIKRQKEWYVERFRYQKV